MTRSALIADVRVMAKSVGEGILKDVQALRFDPETEEVHMSFRYGAQNTLFNVNILCGDQDQYPNSRHYFISTTDSTPGHVWTADRVHKKLQAGKKCITLLKVIKRIIDEAVPTIIIDSDGSDAGEDEDDDEAAFDVELQDDPDIFPTSVIGTKRRRPSGTNAIKDSFGIPIVARLATRPKSSRSGFTPTSSSRPRYSTEISERARKTRISEDLQAVFDSGYYFGIIDDISPDADDVILSVSCRIWDLKLPYFMLLAWSLHPHMYFVLLIHFSKGYFAYEPVSITNAEAGLAFRVGACTHYKPTKQQAYAAFGLSYTQSMADADANQSETSPDFKKILISSALGKLMSDSFLAILRVREETGRTWAEALKVTSDPLASLNWEKSTLPPSPTTDRVKSLPLLAMQFAVDHLTNYTKYCQSCHSELDKSWKSLKPTTCSRELCLYQHMQIGLTQYLEYEIICQPAVIDLLINICYVALSPRVTQLNPRGAPAMRELPSGPRLLVPNLHKHYQGFAETPDNLTRLNVSIARNVSTGEQPIQMFAEGEWVAVSSAPPPYAWEKKCLGAIPRLWHAEITKVDYGNSTVYLGGTTARPFAAGGCVVYRCTKHIQEVPEFLRCQSLKEILDTVPPVAQIKTLLEDPSVGSLKSIKGVSLSAVALLEWILATNRSCIVEITDPKLKIKEQLADVIQPPAGWLQFYFLHGPPNAEAEFEENMMKPRLGGVAAETPTLLAWHGSQIQNWHSILRTGLDYNEQLNGRAFGNGVYFSPHFKTSSLYASSNTIPQWRNAAMDLESMISLNEVLNRTSEFVSDNPHYVVNQRNWSRCRFLFARPKAAQTGSIFRVPSPTDQTSFTPLHPTIAQPILQQDTKRQITGPFGGLIQVPWATMQPGLSPPCIYPTCNLARDNLDSSDMAYLNPETQPCYDVITIDDANEINGGETGASSDSEDMIIVKEVKRGAESLIIISDDDEDGEEDDGDGHRRAGETPFKRQKTMESKEPAHVHVNTDVTPFVPGTLDHSTLRIMAPPSWGAAPAQRALAAGLQELQRVHASTPLPNLGWHIDFDKIDNMFQWVVELHSFDNSIPLAADMNALGVRSIIMEMRFGPDFPITPPFVRVLRPRFKPLMFGGGGNITMGGSMCMELLTTTGWLPTCVLSYVLMQVHLTISTADPPARLATVSAGDYGIQEAVEAYKRSAARHNWTIPADMQKILNGV